MQAGVGRSVVHDVRSWRSRVRTFLTYPWLCPYCVVHPLLAVGRDSLSDNYTELSAQNLKGDDTKERERNHLTHYQVIRDDPSHAQSNTLICQRQWQAGKDFKDR